MLHRLVLSTELGTVQTGTGKVDPARKFICSAAARDIYLSKKNKDNAMLQHEPLPLHSSLGLTIKIIDESLFCGYYIKTEKIVYIHSCTL